MVGGGLKEVGSILLAVSLPAAIPLPVVVDE